MTSYYRVYDDKYTYCKPHPKYMPAEYGCHHSENKFKKKCDCPINITFEPFEGFTSVFTLACGNSLKIFESDEPVEIDIQISLTGDDSCNLKVKAFLQNGNILEFHVTDSNGISFYSKNVRKITLECENGLGIGCEGNWSFSLPLRKLEKNCKCQCPVNELIERISEYSLECGNSLKIFESTKPVEMVMFVVLESDINQNSCDLNVIVELKDGSALEFHVPNPNVIPDNSGSNAIAFYSKNICKVTIECESDLDIGCMGSWNRNIILRGSSIEIL